MPWPRQLIEGEFIWALQFQEYVTITMGNMAEGRQTRHSAEAAKSLHLKLQSGSRESTFEIHETSETSKPSPTDMPLSPRPHLLNLPIQFQQLGPSIQTYELMGAVLIRITTVSISFFLSCHRFWICYSLNTHCPRLIRRAVKGVTASILWTPNDGETYAKNEQESVLGSSMSHMVELTSLSGRWFLFVASL